MFSDRVKNEFFLFGLIAFGVVIGVVGSYAFSQRGEWHAAGMQAQKKEIIAQCNEHSEFFDGGKRYFCLAR